MDHLSFSDRLTALLTGPLYAFLYYTVQHRILGFTLSGWLKNLGFLFSLLALIQRWSIFWIAFGVVLAIVVRGIYWYAKRDGYIRFLPIEDQTSLPAKRLADKDKISIRATGKFSVKDWEDYVLRRPAECWRVPIGDHAIMVEQSPGRYIYQFIQPGSVDRIESGLFCFGSKPEPALAITFYSTWGPDSEDVNFMFYEPGKNDHPRKFRQKIFISFSNQDEKKCRLAKSIA